MPKTLALIHTSGIFFSVDTSLMKMFAEVMPDVKLVNIMDDSLLPTCMAEQRISPAVMRRMCSYVVAAETAGADCVLSLCSSLGPAIDVARKLVSVPVIKIDDAHTQKAASEFNRIGVMATVASTLVPTCALIREKAATLNRGVDIRESLSKAAFEALVAGDKPRHDEIVMDAARKLAPQVDVLLFAQASMTRLAADVESATGKPVLTSPRLAVEYTKQVLDGLRAKSEAHTA
jgi:aspartate/glutamate racemase